MNCLLNRVTCFLECPKWQECANSEMKDTVRNNGGGWVIGSMIIFWAIIMGCILAWATK